MHRQSDALRDMGMANMVKHEGPAAQYTKQQKLVIDDEFLFSKVRTFFF
jgi:hypothetical protein